MEAITEIRLILLCLALTVGAFLYWRYVWFFRNPPRRIPEEDNIVSPADGTVVYVKVIEPDERILLTKKGKTICIEDIVRQDVSSRKILVGIFMSPFDVHYNRSPLSGRIDFITHYPAKRKNLHMGRMHRRVLLKMSPYYSGSRHILENERTVTRMTGILKGQEVGCYVVQIAGGSVSGIDSYVAAGKTVTKGQIFGMIRIGSQVDLIIPDSNDARVAVREGDKVRAGESVLVE